MIINQKSEIQNPRSEIKTPFSSSQYDIVQNHTLPDQQDQIFLSSLLFLVRIIFFSLFNLRIREEKRGYVRFCPSP